ncbi:MAG: hypothetical protein HETSPECPRED_004133 [Heterodermia speciosa]|uniref:Zn(2)-C6 fungal-type domain-containing protein n=1 Tax=Heterodermia speciosa TaxID=116794 RepID=A0A8H3IIG7_9LECA|nr:MAG: hypothetical protein HETSPECPRED_004133 [Heterodermia speciosa]
MDRRHHSAAVDRRPKPQQQILKDTCDMCSASKIKCDKQKPICGRCERLDYPCFFSPARRVRKHRQPQRQLSNARRRAEEEPSSVAESIATSRDRSVTAFSQTSADLIDPSSSFKTNRASFTEFMESSPSSMPGDNDIILPEASGDDNRGPGAALPDHGELLFHSDCMAVAMCVLQQTNSVIGDNLPIRPLAAEGSAAGLDTLVNAASAAIKHVSTMLICPCSTSMDAGLLAAAACATIVDTYQVILQRSISLEQLSSSAKRQMYQHDERSATVRLLGELPKLANLVTQFTRRYRQDMDKSPKDLRQVLATSLTIRLKALVNEVTNWVAQI